MAGASAMSIMVRATLSYMLYIFADAVCLFGAAGRFDVPEFWLYLALMVVLYLICLPFIDPDVAAERMRPGGQAMPPRMWGLIAVILGHFLVAGYDRGRLHWGGGVPVALVAAGFAAVAAMWLVMLWATRVNRYFSSVARLQPERGQHVITTGPYRFVRHPAYTMLLLGGPGNGLALGSWLAAAIGLVAIPLAIWRCVGEDRMLRAGLPGYEAYAARVRWRLIPGLW